MKPLTVLTGPAAAGKNTIGHIYATRYCERAAVIDVDVVRGMLRQPHLAPWDGTPGLEQHRLGVKHACMLAKSFLAEGCEVIVLDVVWDDLGSLYRHELAGCFARVVRVMPSWEETLRRLHSRPATISDDEARWVYATQERLQDFDYSLDNTALPPEAAAAWLASLPKPGTGVPG